MRKRLDLVGLFRQGERLLQGLEGNDASSTRVSTCRPLSCRTFLRDKADLASGIAVPFLARAAAGSGKAAASLEPVRGGLLQRLRRRLARRKQPGRVVAMAA